MSTYRDIEMKIIQWAEARKIIPHAKPHTQLLKAFSEMGELADAELKDNNADRQDAIGDVVVCLLNYCALKDIDLVECMAMAYDQIKDRRGHMTPDGTFVKDET
jgi:NTP pyrophosphatase (non-canonical NTP hydrolase)